MYNPRKSEITQMFTIRRGIGTERTVRQSYKERLLLRIFKRWDFRFTNQKDSQSG